MTDESGGLPKARPEFEPAEVDALQADVRKDIEAGEGAIHFSDVLDELNSTQKPETNALSAAERDRIRAEEESLMIRLKRDASIELRAHGMRVFQVARDGAGEGYIAHINDREGRVYEARLTYDETILAGEVDAERVYRMMVEWLINRSLEARAKYFSRMGLTVSG